MTGPSIHPFAFKIHEALARLGLASDGNTIADQVRRLERGLAAEDELSLLFCWLGRCKLVHKLDQLVAPPASRKVFLVPDLLAIFEHEGKEIPVLIEVKTCSGQSLSWRPDYIERLRRYSELIGLPLLVACKWENFALRWRLSEAGCFQQKGATNYKLSNKDAVISNLMFALAGNFALVFREGTSWHSQWKRLTPTKRIAGKRNSFSMTVRPEGDSFYTNASGARIEAPDSLLWTFFMGQPEPFSEEGDIVNLRFATPKNTFQSADRVFEEITTPGRKPPYWRELLCNYGIPNHASSIREVAARRSDIVEKVLIMNPRKMPDFLGGEK